MPNTGSQALAARNVPDHTAEDWPLQQIIEAINGTFGMPFRLTFWDSSITATLNVQNVNGNASAPIAVFRDSAGVAVLDIKKSGVTLGKLLTATIGALIYPTLDVKDSSSGTTQLGVSTTGVTTYPALDVTRGDGTVMIQVTSGGGRPIFPQGVTVSGSSSQFTSTVAFDGNVTFNSAATFAGSVNGLPKIASGSYTGDGTSGAGRNFTTPGSWQPDMLVIVGGNSDATVEVLHSVSTSGATRNVNSGNIVWTTAVHLLTDGFRVGDGGTNGNINLRDYKWTAWKAS